MNRRAWVSDARKLMLGGMLVGLVACASQGPAAPMASAKAWKVDELSQALASPSRPEADRTRDPDRKPAQLMSFFGVTRGMTAMDAIGEGGYLTEVLSITVGPSGRVYLQNPALVLQLQNGAIAQAIQSRLANNRLPNVTRIDGDVPSAVVTANSVDFAITALNLHDAVIRGGVPGATVLVKNLYAVLKPGGVLGVVDHVGNEGGDNTRLHRMPKQQAIDIAKAAGFVVEAQSDLLANSADDHTKAVFDPTVRGKTDQFILRLRKPN
jgi:predicted methyltransferase